MTDYVNAAQAQRALGEHPLFAALAEAQLETLAGLAHPVALRAGETLITEGDAPGDVYLVLTGRLSATVARVDGGVTIVGEIGPGEVVGEMSVFSDLPRSATVVAIRDTTLLRLPRQRFYDFIVADAPALLAMSQLLVSRLESANRSGDRRAALRTFVVVPAMSSVDAETFAQALAKEFGDRRVEVVDRARIERNLGAGVADAAPGSAEGRDLGGYLHDLEVDGALMILVADGGPTNWSARAIRQADRILLLVSGRTLELGDVERSLLFGEDEPRAPIELVIDEASGETAPASAWLVGRPVRRHHHVDPAQPESVRRLARRLTGRGIGLVLSGGGARGFAHLGVVAAFREAGLDFDVWGGASFGASLAAQLAAGWSVDRITGEMVRGTVDVGTLLDVTFPYMSLAKGHTLTNSINETFGDRCIEDLPREFFCVSSDLTAGRLRVHDRGSIAHAVRASVAIPGIFPPVRSAEGHVLVDGGIMDNLPVAEMRSRLDGGKVVAIDLRTRSNLPAGDLSAGGEASGWQPLLRRMNPAKERMDLPRMIDLLIRSTELASGDRHDTADVTLRPPLEGFALLEFGAYESIIESGYTYAKGMIEAEGRSVFLPV